MAKNGVTTNAERSAKVALTALAFLGLTAAAGTASAESIIKQPGEHPHYPVEVEPHLNLSPFGFYGVGYGIGGRVSIPIVQDGFIPTINNSVAITFGLDFNHYGCYYDYSDCAGVNYLFVPVALQWNFFLTHEWSVFGEPGIALEHAFFEDYCVNTVCVGGPTHTTVTPVFNVGARYHFTDHIALTMRVGYPTFSVGVSFW